MRRCGAAVLARGAGPPISQRPAARRHSWPARRPSSPMPDSPSDDEASPGRSHACPRAPSASLGAGGLVRYDPLRAYMAEVSRHPLLTREEEHELAVRYRETGDVDAAYRLVTANLRLVVKIAYEYRRTAYQLLDLVQEGNIGLMQAVQEVRPVPRREALVLRGVVDPRLHPPVHPEQLAAGEARHHAGAAEAVLQPAQGAARSSSPAGSSPTPRLLAERLDVAEKDVEEMDAPGWPGRPLARRPAAERRGRRAPDPARSRRVGRRERADERIGDEQLRRLFREKLEAFAKTLRDEKERYIFERRLLPQDGEAPLTLQEIGDRFGSAASARARSRRS